MCLQKHILCICTLKDIHAYTICMYKGCAPISIYIPLKYTVVKACELVTSINTPTSVCLHTHTHAQHNAEQNNEVSPKLKLETVCKSLQLHYATSWSFHTQIFMIANALLWSIDTTWMNIKRSKLLISMFKIHMC